MKDIKFHPLRITGKAKDRAITLAAVLALGAMPFGYWLGWAIKHFFKL